MNPIVSTSLIIVSLILYSLSVQIQNSHFSVSWHKQKSLPSPGDLTDRNLVLLKFTFSGCPAKYKRTDFIYFKSYLALLSIHWIIKILYSVLLGTGNWTFIISWVVYPFSLLSHLKILWVIYPHLPDEETETHGVKYRYILLCILSYIVYNIYRFLCHIITTTTLLETFDTV